MAEQEKRKSKCSICKEPGHNKSKCPKKPVEYEEVKITQVPEPSVMYILLESGIYGYTEYLPRVVEICKTPEDVVDCSNEIIDSYFRTFEVSEEEYEKPKITIEKIHELIAKQKTIVQIIAFTDEEHEEETKHSVARYRLRMQVFHKPIRN